MKWALGQDGHRMAAPKAVPGEGAAEPLPKDKLDVQEIIGSQASEAHLIDALSHHIREALQDGRQFQYGRVFP